VDEGLAALRTAQANFARVSFDLIYALPGQALGDWEAALRRALGMGTSHLSLYQLTIEPGTRFAAMAAKGALPQTDPDHAAELFELTRSLTAEAGLPAYEVSNHARLGEESRHNLTYWRYGDYLGVGPGAHGRRLASASFRRKKPENFLHAVARNGHGIESEDALTPETRAAEALLMGLRLDEGVDLAAISRSTGVETLVDGSAVHRLTELGLVRRQGTRLKVSPAGMLLLDRILAEIVAV
jgi:oxygen-independent coproporphyrinogen-3 oxidase